MTDYRVSVDVGAGAPEVWRTWVDVERWPEWTPTVQGVRRLDDGDLRVGSRALVKQPGMPELTWRVTVLDPDREFTWESGRPGVRMVAKHLIEPRGDGACSLTLVFELRGPLEWLGRLLSGRTISRYVGREAEGAKRRAEGAV